ncbi:hypothetical protein AG1IA_10050 [Rhizoctonia solani AG-1 IA]|uniref:Uncharacterized protein n=1 Tax=Thanatephorus cucumeris (strain AG1-IA) TaxID=983506 RepID=L8WD85_THACA|nr:hypothetical protein AG1IA_10050 [Rhizoctonia solani AG-1 IA]
MSVRAFGPSREIYAPLLFEEEEEIDFYRAEHEQYRIGKTHNHLQLEEKHDHLEDAAGTEDQQTRVKSDWPLIEEY